MPTFTDCQELFQKFDRTLLLKQLHEGIVSVRFTKVDGTERMMQCTLNGARIPSIGRITNNTQPIPLATIKAPNPNVCVVFDTEKKEWRSFRYDSVLSTSLDWSTKV